MRATSPSIKSDHRQALRPAICSANSHCQFEPPLIQATSILGSSNSNGTLSPHHLEQKKVKISASEWGKQKHNLQSIDWSAFFRKKILLVTIDSWGHYSMLLKSPLPRRCLSIIVENIPKTSHQPKKDNFSEVNNLESKHWNESCKDMQSSLFRIAEAILLRRLIFCLRSEFILRLDSLNMICEIVGICERLKLLTDELIILVSI
ncbi:unnamed protein product, partial [Thlaspi arvense]